jgi:hypothetical protein
MKVVSGLFEITSYLGNNMLKIRWGFGLILKTGEHRLHRVLIGLIRNWEPVQGPASDFCVAGKRQKPGSSSQSPILAVEERRVDRRPNQTQQCSQALDRSSDQMDVWFAVVRQVSQATSDRVGESIDDPEQSLSQRLVLV